MKGELFFTVFMTLIVIALIYALWCFFYLVVYRKRKYNLPNPKIPAKSKKEFNLNQQFYNLFFHVYSGNAEKASRTIDVPDAKKYMKTNWKIYSRQQVELEKKKKEELFEERNLSSTLVERKLITTALTLNGSDFWNYLDKNKV